MQTILKPSHIKYTTLATLLIVLSVAIAVTPAHAVTVTETNVFPTPNHFPQNKQNESPMAVNPTDSSNVITGANDEIEEPDCTPASGGSSSCPFAPGIDTSGVYWTTDGGLSWNHQILHWSSSPLGVTSDGDPIVTFGPKPDGNGGFSYASGARAYFGSLASAPNFGPNQEVLAVSFSDDGGATWSNPVLATSRANPVDFNDKPAIWADQNPSSPHFGNVYVTWTLFKGAGNFGESNTFSPEPIMFTSSTDGGQTFGHAQQLSQAANNGVVGGRQGSEIRTGPDGTVYVFWDGAVFHQSAILAAKSTNGGKGFSKPFLVSFKSDVPSPFPGASFRDNSFPMADIDQGSGKIFVVWANYTFGSAAGHGVVAMATSNDNGATWSTASIADVTGRSAFYPAVAVDPADGSNVFVGFNAIDDVPFGTAPGAGVVFYDAYYVVSADAGGTFSAPAKISAASSDPDVASTNSLGAQFIGDYNGVSASSTAAWFSWTDGRNGATCSNIDTFRAGGAKPNIYDSCPVGFGNTDIYVAQVTWT